MEEDRDDDLNFDLEDDEDPLTYTKTVKNDDGPPLNNPFKQNTMKAKRVEEKP